MSFLRGNVNRKESRLPYVERKFYRTCSSFNFLQQVNSLVWEIDSVDILMKRKASGFTRLA